MTKPRLVVSSIVLAVGLALGGVWWFGSGAPSLPAEPPPTPSLPSEAPPREATPAKTNGDGAKAFKLRVVAANLSTGRRQSYDPGHGERILRALRPDVVLIQELNVGRGSDAELRAFAEAACGEGFHVHRETGAQIPNGVISRWPILAKGQWEDDASPNREFAWARIDVPGTRDLWAVSVHLLTKKNSVRAREGEQLAGYLRANVPERDFLVVGGDLNTRDPHEPVLRILAPLVGSERVPVDSQGRRGTNASRKRPYDWVLPDKDLEAHHIPVELGGRSFPSGLVFDTRSFPALDALENLQPADSGADQMQHMAVVRDFMIPIDR